MRILHLDTRPDWRGGQHQILLTMRGQRARGHQVELFSRSDSLLGRRADAEGFSAHRFSPHPARWQATLALRRILQREKFDIVHAHDAHALTAAWLARAARRSALIVSRRVANPLSRVRLGLGRYRAAHRILAVSQFVAESVIASGIDQKSVGIVYDGVEIPPEITPQQRRAARAGWKIAEEEILLGCIGYLLPEKGQEVLLRAMPIVRKEFPGCRLILAGPGPCLGRLEALAREIGVEGSVIFAGFVEDVGAVYCALDLFVFPSLAEPLGSALLAAMAYGLPAVAVASGGVPEIIQHNRNGILIPGAQAQELAKAIQALLADPVRRPQLGQAGRRTVEERFSADRLAGRTLEEYGKALAEKERE
jgi:glycosyltransferase involved in cell wall biosynthesis